MQPTIALLYPIRRLERVVWCKTYWDKSNNPNLLSAFVDKFTTEVFITDQIQCSQLRCWIILLIFPQWWVNTPGVQKYPEHFTISLNFQIPYQCYCYFQYLLPSFVVDSLYQAQEKTLTDNKHWFLFRCVNMLWTTSGSIPKHHLPFLEECISYSQLPCSQVTVGATCNLLSQCTR